MKDLYVENYKKLKELKIDTEIDETARELHYWENDAFGGSSNEFSDESEEKHLFYDRYSNRFFKSTFTQVLLAEYHFNRNFSMAGDALLNDWYAMIGLDPYPGGDDMFWSMEWGIYWVDFNHIRRTTRRGTEYYEIQFVLDPEPMEMDDSARG